MTDLMDFLFFFVVERDSVECVTFLSALSKQIQCLKHYYCDNTLIN